MRRESRHEYAPAIAGRYRRASRRGKGQTLNEFCAATGYHRKYATGLLQTVPAGAESTVLSGGGSSWGPARPTG